MGNNVCYHFIINIFATFCWLNTDHQKTLSKAVCTYLSTNCHVYVACVRCEYVCVQGKVMSLDGWQIEPNRIESNRIISYRTVPYCTVPYRIELNRTESNRTEPNWTESNRIGPDHIKFDISFFLYYFTNYIIEKSHKLFASATRLR